MGMTSKGYTLSITGDKGREQYRLTYKGRLVGAGDLRQAVAKGAGRDRLQRFQRQCNALSNAEARLRKFRLDSHLSESP